MLQGILKGLVVWLYELILSGVEYVSNALLDVFKMDLAYFEANVPITNEIFSVIVATGWAILIGNLAFQAMKTMASGIGFEGEDPKILFCRTFVFGFLLLASRQICGIGMAISSSVIELLQVPTSVVIPKLELDAFDFESSWIIAVVVGLILIFQIIKFFFEMGERYVILVILTILAPLAFGVGGSKSTEDLFKGWARMFGSMCLMMVMNVVFLKILLSAMGTIPVGPAILPWLIFVVAIGRVARKIDDVISRIGLNTAKTGDPLGRGNLPGMLTMAVAKRMTSTGMSGSSSARPQASGRETKVGANRNNSNGNAGKSPSSPHFGSNNGVSSPSQSNSAVVNSAVGTSQNAAQSTNSNQSSAAQSSMHAAAGNVGVQNPVNSPQNRPPTTNPQQTGSAKTNAGVRTQSVPRQESHSAGTSSTGTTLIGKDVPNRPPIGGQPQVPRQETKISESSHISQSGLAGTATAGTSSTASGIPNRPPIGRPTASQVDKGAQSMSRQEISGSSKLGSTQGVTANLGRNGATTTSTVKNTSIQSSQGVAASLGRKSATPTGNFAPQPDKATQPMSRQETSKSSISRSPQNISSNPGRNSPDLYSRSSNPDIPPLQNQARSRNKKPKPEQNYNAKEGAGSACPKRPPIGTRGNNRGDKR